MVQFLNGMVNQVLRITTLTDLYWAALMVQPLGLPHWNGYGRLHDLAI